MGRDLPCAIARAGAIGVPISYDATEPEIAYRLADANCRAIVTTGERGDLVAKLQADAPNLPTVIATDRGSTRATALRYESSLATLPKSAPRDPAAMHEPAFILYTSGTTGRAKGVLLTVHGMLWIVAACWAPIAGLSERDTVLSPLPLFHSYALNLSVLGILATGASEYIMEKFSTSEAVRLLKTGEFTCLPRRADHVSLSAAGDARRDGHQLPESAALHLGRRHHAGDAQPRIRGALRHSAARRLRHHRNLHHGDDELADRRRACSARAASRCRASRCASSIRRAGATSTPGQEGELIVRGPNVMPGYHNKPEETAKALRNGWYHTGDLAKSDENGFLTITGRLKELIIRGGQNIAPAEIEEVVNTFAAVLDCAVVGVPHEHLGEVPVAVRGAARRPDGRDRSAARHCRAHLSAYKVPHAVHLIKEIPRTGSGKIIRYKLREQLDG